MKSHKLCNINISFNYKSNTWKSTFHFFKAKKISIIKFSQTSKSVVLKKDGIYKYKINVKFVLYQILQTLMNSQWNKYLIIASKPN